MPRPTLPPTPASSTDIKGKDGSQSLAELQMAFELPPPAITQDPSRVPPTDTRTSPNALQQASPKKSTYPMQAAEAVKSRRRASSAAQKSASAAGTESSFALPPPPTRSRKIIQMKPCPSQEMPSEAPTAPASSKTSKTPTNASSCASSNNRETTSKKKAPSATSAAGRKTARKTAHSLIERRRRSKMNEEFAVLKDMIPACTGEMHKLAILQASIEYVRYLEDCVSKLKAQRDVGTPTEPTHQSDSGRTSWNPIPQFQPSYRGDPSADVDMTGSEAASPTFTAQPSRTQQPFVSPALAPEDARDRHNSYSSTSTDHRHYSYSSSSATTSPAFGPQSYQYGRRGDGGASLPPSALPSPALAPQREQRDLDQEATAALLMLNSDRRGASGRESGSRNGNGATQSGGRGMSVRDLLSTW